MMLLAASSAARATLKSRIGRKRHHLLTTMSLFSSSSRSTASTITSPSSSSDDKRKLMLLSPHRRCNLIFGANSDVGKTVIATGLCRAALERGAASNDKQQIMTKVVHYIKPMQCGGSDQTTVEATIQKLVLTKSKDSSVTSTAAGASSFFHAHTLFRWETATSPHVASRLEGLPLSDKHLMNTIQSTLMKIEQEDCNSSSSSTTTTYIETAGGVMSPSSSSPDNQSLRHAMGQPANNDTISSSSSSSSSWGWLTQADLYQPLLGYAPVVLVGDGRLGGISATLSSLESLILRGYDVVAIILLETNAGGFMIDNVAALREYATRRLPLYSGTGERAVFTSMPLLTRQSIVSLPPIPTDISIPLDDWYMSPRVVETFAKLDEFLHQSWQGQVADLASLQSAARNVLWCRPSTVSQQQQDDHDIGNNEDDNTVLFLDSASGNELYLIDASRIKSQHNSSSSSSSSSSGSSMVGGASLERRTIMDHTRHIFGHGESNLTLANAAALSRYGGGAHQLDEKDLLAHAPAIALSQKLLGSTTADGHGCWAHRVLFHNDNNKDPLSWCCFVAIEMGLKTFQKRSMSFHENNKQDDDNAVDFDDIEWVICGQFNGSAYHHYRELDDDKNDSNDESTVQGLFLETPTISFQNGRALSIRFPQGYDPSQGTTGIEFDSIAQVMDVEARILSRKLFSQYKELIEMQWLVYEHSRGFHSKIGTVVLEPLVLMNRHSSSRSSNGTLELVDPLWQRALMDIAKSRNVPVVWNETSLTSDVADDLCQVMGLSSSCKILKSNPDIACYTLQHLVGGLVDPMQVTLASKEVFETMKNDDHENVLYHSIPHPVRCVNALYALEAQEAMMSLAKMPLSGLPRMIFDEQQIRQLSELPLVERSFAFGTLCAVTITARPSDESVDETQKDDTLGASLSLAVFIVQNLRQQDIPAHSLGKTMYMVASPTADRQECTRLLQVLHQTIERHGHAV